MDEQPRTREELYDRIRSSSKNAFILEDMIRLGFWSSEQQLAVEPAEDTQRRTVLAQQIAELRTKTRQLHNEEQLLKELRKKRLLDSRQKQKETRERRVAERQARAVVWQHKQQRELVYLGAGVSAGLGQLTSDEERLRQNQLPVLHTPAQLAEAMGISLGTLRFLAFARKTSKRTHYIRFRVPKKTGGTRLISAPMPRLKATQTWILQHILNPLEPHPKAHGFRQCHSIVTNAAPHVGAEVIINLDLKDFFPTVSYPRIKGFFRSLGYAEALATVMGLICTEANVTEIVLDHQTYFVAQTERHLPQGAPSSPALTNLICRRLDRRLEALAQKYDFTYTRYADDLTFSASGKTLKNICNILKQTQAIVAHEGFTVHPEKTRVIRRSRQQEVTGVVVNEKPNVDRKTLKLFRATLYQIEKDGPAGKHWGSCPDLLASIQGFAHFVHMVNPDKGAIFQAQVKRIIAKYGRNTVATEAALSTEMVTEPVKSTEVSPEAPTTSVETIRKWWQRQPE